MNPTLFKAVGVVTVALIFYSIAVIREQRKSLITRQTLSFLTAGVACDIASTGLMIAGSGNIPITVHGFIGYSALLVMLIDTILIWRLWTRMRSSVTDSGTIADSVAEIPRKLHIYTRIDYIWWVVDYFEGAIIAATLSS